MPDLTRFDFYAMRFAHSEAVQAMDASETGAYILLLCEAWLTGKDASIPDDRKWIDRVSKGAATDLVLVQFPIVDTSWGPRRRNRILFEEWQKALTRSENGKAAVAMRYDRSTNVQPTYNDGKTTDVTQAKPSQAVSDQTKSSQGDFSNISIKYRAAMKKSHSKAKNFKSDYQKLCSTYGEQTVLEVFDEWAENNKWRADNLRNSGLRFFFADLPELVSEIQAANKVSTEQNSGVDMGVIQELLVRHTQSVQAESETKIMEFQAEEKSIEGVPIDAF